MFWPWLMPLSTKSGRSGISASMASMTQSVGVPSTCHLRSPRRTGRSGWCSVSECDVALCSRSGATTVTSPSGSAAAHRHSMPCARIPSSFVTSRRISVGEGRRTERREKVLEIRLQRLQRLHGERTARDDFEIALLAMVVHLLPRALDRVLLVVKQMLHEHDQLHLAPLIDAVARPVLGGAEKAELALPIPQHVRFESGQLADFPDGEKLLNGFRLGGRTHRSCSDRS